MDKQRSMIALISVRGTDEGMQRRILQWTEMKAMKIREGRANDRDPCSQPVKSSLHATPHPNTTSGSHNSRLDSRLELTPFTYSVHILDNEVSVNESFHNSPHPSIVVTSRPEDVPAESVDTIDVRKNVSSNLKLSSLLNF